MVMMGQRSPPAPIGYVGREAKTVVMIMVIYLQEMDEYLCTQRGRRTARSVSTGGRDGGASLRDCSRAKCCDMAACSSVVSTLRRNSTNSAGDGDSRPTASNNAALRFDTRLRL